VCSSDLNANEARQSFETLRFLIFSSLKEEQNEFNDVVTITPIIAALKYFLRLSCLQECFNVPNTLAGRPVLNNLLLSLKKDENTSFGAISDIMSLCTAIINNNIWKDAQVECCLNKNGTLDTSKVKMNNKVLSLDMINMVVIETRRQCLEHINLITKGMSLPTLFSKGIQDQVGCTEYGYSFLDEPKNRSFARCKNILTDYMEQKEHLGSYFFNEDLTLKIRPARTWIDIVEKLLRKILFLIHVTGGGTARATELSTMKVRNLKGSRRSIFFSHECICIQDPYLKTQSQTKRESQIARFLTAEDTEIVLKYLLLIRPLESLIASKIYAAEEDGQLGESQQRIASLYKHYFFVRKGRRYSDQEIRDTLPMYFNQFAKVDLKFSEYRHLQQKLTEINHTFKTDLDLTFLRQAGHSITTALTVYARSNADFGSVDRSIIETCFYSSRIWQSLCNIIPLPDTKQKLVQPVEAIQANSQVQPACKYQFYTNQSEQSQQLW
jgi:hypothetical protein